MITATTRVGASLGRWNPGRRTTSPIMFNAAFRELGLDYRWFAFEPDDIGAAMRAVRTLNFVGASITKPFKEQVIGYLDELDPTAAAIGAVNQVQNEGGRLTGYNTDWLGAAGALAERCLLAGQRVAVLGSGGAARAVVFGLVRSGCEVRVFSRSQERGSALAGELGASFGGQIAEVSAATPGILVNATSIGNDLQADVPVPDSAFDSARVVMDIITRPGRSPFLDRAAAAGADVIGGARMLVLQGIYAIRLFTGATAPVETMQRAVERALGGERTLADGPGRP